MKIAALLMLSGLVSASDPGCGAGLGSNTANGPDGGTPRTEDGGAATNVTKKDCGALGSHLFCDDFEGKAPPSEFDMTTQSSGTLAITDNELVASTTAANALRTFARLEKRFNVNGDKFELAYTQTVDPGCIGPSDGVETGVIGVHSGLHYVALRHGSPDHILEVSLANGFYAQAHNLPKSMPRGGAVKIVLSVDYATNMIALSVDGEAVVANEPLKYPPASIDQSMIAVGTLTDNGTGKPAACTVKIDDVTLDVE
jgi:hypothetical protein